MEGSEWVALEYMTCAIFVWTWKMASVISRYLFFQPMDEKIKTWTLRFPAKETQILRRHCSIGQSCCSTSKCSIDGFLESSPAWSFFLRELSLNQPKATRVCICSINQSNRSISVRYLFPLCSCDFISRPYENRSIIPVTISYQSIPKQIKQSH